MAIKRGNHTMYGQDNIRKVIENDGDFAKAKRMCDHDVAIIRDEIGEYQKLYLEAEAREKKAALTSP